MKITAYQCDNCGTIHIEDEIIGVSIEQPNLFENKFIYSSSGKPDHCIIHFCHSCYQKHVMWFMKDVERRNNEADWSGTLKLYANKFYERLHFKVLKRKK